jgi:phosphoribosylformylglycinamidine (FGAM) synthase PurS component
MNEALNSVKNRLTHSKTRRTKMIAVKIEDKSTAKNFSKANRMAAKRMAEANASSIRRNPRNPKVKITSRIGMP